MLVERFIRYLKFEKRYSSHTVSAYEADLADFEKYLHSELLELESVSHNEVRTWVMNLMESGLSGRSVSRKLSTLRSFYKFHLREGTITSSPMNLIRAPKLAKLLPVVIEESKMDLLLDGGFFDSDFAGLRDRLVIELLYCTGMRQAEIRSLRTTDVDEFECQLTVLGKRNKQRIIPISRRLLDLIKQYEALKLSQNFRNNSEALIVTNMGKAAGPGHIYDIVRSGLSKITTQSKRSPHVLRHSFATAMLNRGADLNAIKEILGHSSLAATQVYTHNSIEKLKSVYKQAHPKA